jgi:hypothetical protein
VIDNLSRAVYPPMDPKREAAANRVIAGPNRKALLWERVLMLQSELREMRLRLAAMEERIETSPKLPIRERRKRRTA